MKILIYGAGAVGLGMASFLLKSGQTVDIIARKDTVSALKEKGLARSGIFGEYHAHSRDFGSYPALKELPAKAYDYILVCTKSYDTLSSAQDIAASSCSAEAGAKIVLFQNGWGNAEVFASSFPQDKIYSARVITGFRRPQKNRVEVTVHADAIHVGSLFGEDISAIEPLCLAINGGDMPCQPTGEIEKDLWAKMLYNCTLNPLGAILGVPYGALGKQAHTRNIMRNIAEEIFQVLEKSGYSTYWQNAEDYLADFYQKMLPPTAGHESSMLQDIRSQKKTEIEALNGAVIRLGNNFQIPVPTNSAMYDMIKFIESRN